MIQRACLHAHKNFVGTNYWIGNVFVLQNIGRAVLMKYDCFHETSAAKSKIER